VCKPALSSCSIIVIFEFDRVEIAYAKVVPRIPAPIITTWLLFMVRHSFLYLVLFPYTPVILTLPIINDWLISFIS
jgi:hypothetical protein